MTNLRNIVNMAFEEGSRSPYDLKPLIVDKLIKDTSVISEIKLNLEAMSKMVQRCLPQHVLMYLRASDKVWLSGGSILKSILDPKNTTSQWKTSDYDIFCQHSVFSKITNNKLSFLAITTKYSFRTARIDDINFIVSDKFTSWDKVVEDFDINVLKFAYEEQLVQEGYFAPKIYANEKTQQDFIYNRLSLTNAKMRSLLALKSRLKKYVKRGFRDTTGLIIKNKIQELYMDNNDESY